MDRKQCIAGIAWSIVLTVSRLLLLCLNPTTERASDEESVMGKMCTIVATVLGCTLLLLSIVFIGASSRLEEGRFAERPATDTGAEWDLISADTVPPIERLVHYDELRRENGDRELGTMLDEDLNAENSHVVVQVYSVDSDQEQMNESSPSGAPIRSVKVHKYGKPKEQMDGRATDRVERKVYAPVRNIQEQLTNVESGEVQQQSATKETLLQEGFYVDDIPTREPVPDARRRFSNIHSSTEDASVGVDVESQQPPSRHASARSQVFPPFFDYNEQTSQRMLEEFFALRNQDSLASQRSHYDWDEGQFRSRTLEEIKNQNRAAVSASRKKAPLDNLMGLAARNDADMGYERYADYAEMEQRMATGFGPHKLGRKQRATPSTNVNPTHVLNRTPIVSTNGDGSVPLLGKEDGSARSQIERSRFHYSLPSMVFNPYAWDPYHLNMLRFPQCNACQQNARALCGKCGLCNECCAHSKCTCGCLNG